MSFFEAPYFFPSEERMMQKKKAALRAAFPNYISEELSDLFS